MNKRLLKRHKRQVSRAKERVRLSEPDRQNTGTIEGGSGGEPSCRRLAPRRPSTLRDADYRKSRWARCGRYGER